jgi:hypothetical protein
MKLCVCTSAVLFLWPLIGCQQRVPPIQQYQDNRAFTSADGRQCVGSELNGRLAGNEQHPRIDRNRVINPRPLAPDMPLLWEVAKDTPVYDGSGAAMGTVAPTVKVGERIVCAIKVNYGMSKVIHGRMCVYGFSFDIKPAAHVQPLLDRDSIQHGVVSASAWVPLDKVVEGEMLKERVGIGRATLPKLPLQERRYRMTGGDPRSYLTDTGDELRIVLNPALGAVPSHYLRRPCGTVNILYCVPGFGLGGQSLDSFLISSSAIFRPAKGARMFIMPTYYPPGHPSAGKTSGKTMTFIYGAVESPGNDSVYGWVAKEALTPVENN